MPILPGALAPGAPRTAPSPMGASPAAPAAAMPDLGLQSRARGQVVIARKLLENALSSLGTDTDEGKKLLTALKALADVFTGSPSGGLLKNEVKALGASATPGLQPAGGMPMGGPTPMNIAGM